jgi:hypothetical protein
MIPARQKVYTTSLNPVDEAMLLGNTPAPYPETLQEFWLPDTLERLATSLLNQIQYFDRSF